MFFREVLGMAIVCHVSRGARTSGEYVYCKPRSEGTGDCPLYPGDSGDEHHAVFTDSSHARDCNRLMEAMSSLDSVAGRDGVVPGSSDFLVSTIRGFMSDCIDSLKHGGDVRNRTKMNGCLQLAEEAVAKAEAEKARSEGTGGLRKDAARARAVTADDARVPDDVRVYYEAHPDVDARGFGLVEYAPGMTYYDAVSAMYYPDPVDLEGGFGSLYPMERRRHEAGFDARSGPALSPRGAYAMRVYSTEAYSSLNAYMRAKACGDAEGMARCAEAFRDHPNNPSHRDVEDVVADVHDAIASAGTRDERATVFRVDFHPDGGRSAEEIELYRAAVAGRPYVSRSFLSTTMMDPEHYQEKMAHGEYEKYCTRGPIFVINLLEDVPARAMGTGVNSSEAEVLLDSGTQLVVDRIYERSRIDPSSPNGWSGKGPIIMMRAVPAGADPDDPDYQ